jgi:hypothetical protein
MTTTQPTDFSLITEAMLDNDTYAAMLRVYRDRTCPGLCQHKEADVTAIGILHALRDEYGVNFTRHPRGDGWIELNRFAQAYIVWREGMRK